MHQLDLLDLTGNILRSIISFEEKVQLDLQSLHSGMYIIRTASKERTSSKIFTKI
ncbi:MAG: T9SS type A sorting domain-containing protein [Saprospiraceae bacterium]|nr:T9SS type A sorting domain-containing protein [Saprospiraceae bacterium]